MFAILKEKQLILKTFLLCLVFLSILFIFTLYLFNGFHKSKIKQESISLVDSIQQIFLEYESFATILGTMYNAHSLRENDLQLLLANYHFVINPDALYILEIDNGKLISKNEVTYNYPLLLNNIIDIYPSLKEASVKYMLDGDLIYIFYAFPSLTENTTKSILVFVIDRDTIYKIFPHKFNLSLNKGTKNDYLIKDILYLRTLDQPLTITQLVESLSLGSMICFFITCCMGIFSILHFANTKRQNLLQSINLTTLNKANQDLGNYNSQIIDANKKLAAFYNRIFGQYVSTDELVDRIQNKMRLKELGSKDIVDILHECKDIIAPLLNDSKINFELSSLEDFEPIQLDPFIIKMVLLNLLTKICIRMPIKKGVININMSNNSMHTVISFTDNGFITDITAKIVSLKNGALYLPAPDLTKLLLSIDATLKESNYGNNVTTLTINNQQSAEQPLQNNIIFFPNQNA